MNAETKAKKMDSSDVADLKKIGCQIGACVRGPGKRFAKKQLQEYFAAEAQ